MVMALLVLWVMMRSPAITWPTCPAAVPVWVKAAEPPACAVTCPPGVWKVAMPVKPSGTPKLTTPALAGWTLPNRAVLSVAVMPLVSEPPSVALA